MACVVLVIASSAVVFTALAALALAGFRNGDHSGEALARALRKDLEAAAAEHDRCPPPC